jgi:hypothetical protein
VVVTGHRPTPKGSVSPALRPREFPNKSRAGPRRRAVDIVSGALVSAWAVLGCEVAARSGGRVHGRFYWNWQS